MEKWGSAFWADLLERVGTTAIYGVIAMLTADQTGVISGNADQWWAVVGLPAALSFLKCLLANLKTEAPTASVINVTSKTATPSEGGAWSVVSAVGVLLICSGLLLLVLSLGDIFAVSNMFVLVLIVIGVVLVVVDRRGLP